MSDGRVNNSDQQEQEQNLVKAPAKRSLGLLITTYGCLFVGSVASSLLAKYYFVHGGSSRWVSTWVQSAGFPLLLVLIYFPHFVFKTTKRRPFTRFTQRHLFFSVVIGLFLGFNNFLFSWGTSYLPVSTSSLLLSTQLIFTLILSVIIVKQKVTFSNLNCVVLLTLSSVLLALGSSQDKPAGLTKTKYFIGFLSTIGAGLLFALYLPVTERVYRSVYCYAMVMEMQLVMEFSATVFATVGMAFDGGFKEMVKEANQVFTKGPTVYWTVAILANVVTWQLCFAATSGMVYLTSGITGGICMTALLAMNVIGGVVVYGDEFGGVKIVSTVLCIWGFSSYVYGLYVKMKKEEKKEKEEKGYTGVKTAEDGGEMQVEMGKVKNDDVAAADERV
ncbi:putative purine permease 4 [Raphanus sativus]|uniref:Probable purine permease n=1 Tax=Raphanus sativus TaxID=3726 RepID=A0A9W3BRQ5_RAPSA|nr:probable purine permease 4 [Raphanus sativus]KAJ4916940.1 putative purine permease 4 [Raphanus sativus]